MNIRAVSPLKSAHLGLPHRHHPRIQGIDESLPGGNYISQSSDWNNSKTLIKSLIDSVKECEISDLYESSYEKTVVEIHDDSGFREV